MIDWMKGPGAGGRSSLDEVGPGVDAMNAAIDKRDVAQLKSACQLVTDPLTIQLPTSIPSPDADITNAFEVLTQNGETLAAACGGLSDPPAAEQLDTLESAMRSLGSNLRTTGAFLKRDGQIMMNAS